jgi:hypothetical protein
MNAGTDLDTEVYCLISDVLIHGEVQDSMLTVTLS